MDNKRKKLSLEDCHIEARRRCGKCHDKKWLGSKRKLTWECKIGHTWMATPSSILSNGSWCPNCALSNRSLKYSIEDMRKLAHRRSGRCISKDYKGMISKLTWECQEGHRWMSTPNNIKAGSWCPLCRKKKHNLDKIMPSIHKLSKNELRMLLFHIKKLIN